MCQKQIRCPNGKSNSTGFIRFIFSAEQPVPQQRKPKIEEPPKQLSKSLLVDDSSSDDSLFKIPPVLQKPALPVKKVESQTEVVVKSVPVQKSAETSAQKPTTKPVATPAKKSLASYWSSLAVTNIF